MFPISSIFIVETEESKGRWVDIYVLNSFEYATFYIFLIILLTLIPILKNDLRKVLIGFSLILSTIGSFVVLQFAFMPIQDFAPKFGMEMTIFILPITVINSLIEWGEHKVVRYNLDK